MSSAGEWQLCGDRFYERSTLYHLDWDVELNDMRIAMGKYGGPVALLRDDRKPVRLRPGEAHTPAIRVASAAGHFLGGNSGGTNLSSFSSAATVPWPHGMVAGMNWSDEEDLVVVGATTGEAHVFPLDAFMASGSNLSSSSSSRTLSPPPRVLTLGTDAARDGVASVAFWGDGLVAMTKRGALVVLDGFAEPRVEPLPSPLLEGSKSSSSSSQQQQQQQQPLFTTTTAPPLAVLPPAASPTGSARAIVASGREMVVCDARLGTPKAKATMNKNVAAIAVSPCGGFVAAADEDARLVVWSSDFSRALSEFATQASKPPDALAWCGSDSVVMLWKGGIGGDDEVALSSSTFAAASTPFPESADSSSSNHSLLLMVGPFGDWVKYDATGVAAVSTEPDGLRVLSSERNDLLRRVPDALADALRPGSTAPSAALRDARRALDGKGGGGVAGCVGGSNDATPGGALGALRALPRKALPRAAVAAADAARAALKPSTQEELLKAAALGVAFALGGGTAEDDDDEEDEDGEEEGGEEESGTRKRTTQASATRSAAAAVASAISEIRVLRAARDNATTTLTNSAPTAALPLTSRQLELLGASSLVGRLARRGHHLLALRSAAALGAPASARAGVAAHWAAAVISSPASAAESDEALAAKIRSRLETVAMMNSGSRNAAVVDGNNNATASAPIRYGALAAVAAAAGRRTLAATLLEAEPVPRERVPLLLRLGDGARALDAALSSSDFCLISSVLLGSGGGGSGELLLQKTRASPVARAVIARSALDAAEAERVGVVTSSNSFPLPLTSVPLQAAERVLGPAPAAVLKAEAALSCAAGAAASAVAARREGRGKAERAAGDAAARALDDAAASFSRALSSTPKTANVDVGFYASAASEGASLRRLQAQLESSTGHSMLVGLSAAETLGACLKLAEEGGGGGGESDAASAATRRCRAELRISDRRWAWARLRARCERRDWGAVEAMLSTASDVAALGGASGGRSKSSTSTLLTPAIVVEIARMAKRHGAPESSLVKLMGRLPDDGEKVEALGSVGLRREAVRVAERVRSLSGGGGIGGSSGQGPAEELMGRLQGVLSFGRGLVGGGGGR